MAACTTSSGETDAEEGDVGGGIEEDDLFSSIREYLTHRGRVARTQIGHTGQLGEARQVVREDRQTGKDDRQGLDSTRAKVARGRPKKRHVGGVHVSFRPSTESVQFHNPLESKEAHWKARLRRLSHFHTHSHSAGERPGAGTGAGGKLGAGSAGKFGSVAGVSHKVGAYERSGSGDLMVSGDNAGAGAGGLENRAGTGAGDKDKEQHPGSSAGSGLGPELHSEVLSSGSGASGMSAGVRGRLGRSGLRPRASRSRSQEPGSTASRHHQVALLGGVYKTVVHALSSKPRPRGQGSSQGSSPQRQGRAAMGDASLRDLYSHVLGYFGRKTTSPAPPPARLLSRPLLPTPSHLLLCLRRPFLSSSSSSPPPPPKG
uniref:uncharacterized protein n=1 Tax=Centroberyx gerrardi TaxID=166262 RepID=UPI003AAB2CB0